MSTRDEQLGAALRAVLGDWLEWENTLDASERGETVAVVVEGKRIVTITSPGGMPHDGGELWEILDAETREVLGSGRGWNALNDAWLTEWVDEGSLADRSFERTPPPTETYGLPASLVDVLADWVSSYREEAAQLLHPPTTS